MDDDERDRQRAEAIAHYPEHKIRYFAMGDFGRERLSNLARSRKRVLQQLAEKQRKKEENKLRAHARAHENWAEKK